MRDENAAYRFSRERVRRVRQRGRWGARHTQTLPKLAENTAPDGGRQRRLNAGCCVRRRSVSRDLRGRTRSGGGHGEGANRGGWCVAALLQHQRRSLHGPRRGGHQRGAPAPLVLARGGARPVQWVVSGAHADGGGPGGAAGARVTAGARPRRRGEVLHERPRHDAAPEKEFGARGAGAVRFRELRRHGAGGYAGGAPVLVREGVRAVQIQVPETNGDPGPLRPRRGRRGRRAVGRRRFVAG
mmetsp:Transcript_9461/g.16086  ORF Transcript_9461/g.16086 Transcript_9461/m.16086 type:complete len:242 (-) Transcript_9461:631-1356(-)